MNQPQLLPPCFLLDLSRATLALLFTVAQAATTARPPSPMKAGRPMLSWPPSRTT
jgi:hypothetical protein